MKILLVILLVSFRVIHSELVELSCKEINIFVNGHNSRRRELSEGTVPGQPAASNMKLMVWDDELAEKAAKWASNNIFKHNPDRTISSGRFNTGENIYWYGSTNKNYDFNPDAALKSWFDEYQEYSYRPMETSDFDDSTGVDIGHYTQMAWADSIYLGCAISHYWENEWNKFYVVCNYGPGGNYIGQAPYETGPAAGYIECPVDDCSLPEC